MSRRLLLVCLAALALLVPALVLRLSPVEAQTTYNRGTSTTTVVLPRGNSADDQPNLARALPAGASATLVRGATYWLKNVLRLPTRSKLDINGATVYCDLSALGLDAGYNPDQACIQSTWSNENDFAATTTAPLAPGSNVLGITPLGDAGRGQWIQYGWFNAGQASLIESVDAGAGTLILDRPAEWYLDAGSSILVNTGQATDVEIAGGGGSLLVVAAQRGIELTKAQRFYVHDLNIAWAGTGAGAWYAGLSFDSTGSQNVLRNVTFDFTGAPAAPTSDGVTYCLWLENQIDTRVDHVEAKGCSRGLYTHGSTGMTITDLWSHNHAHSGVRLSGLNPGGVIADRGNVMIGGAIESNHDHGIEIADAMPGMGNQSPGWRIQGTKIAYNGNAGIAIINSDVIDDPGGTPRSTGYQGGGGIVLSDLYVVGNYTTGLDCTYGYAPQVRGGHWIANGTQNNGTAMTFRSTCIGPAMITGVTTERNGQAGSQVGSAAITTGIDTIITGLASHDDPVAVFANVAGTSVIMNGFEILSRFHPLSGTDVSNQWNAVILRNGAEARLTGGVISIIGAANWASTHAYTYLQQAVASGARIYELQNDSCTSGGSAPTATPARPTDPAQTYVLVTDGTCQWRYMGAVGTSSRIGVSAYDTSRVFAFNVTIRGNQSAGVDGSGSYGFNMVGGSAYAYYPLSPWLDTATVDTPLVDGTTTTRLDADGGLFSYH